MQYPGQESFYTLDCLEGPHFCIQASAGTILDVRQTALILQFELLRHGFDKNKGRNLSNTS